MSIAGSSTPDLELHCLFFLPFIHFICATFIPPQGKRGGGGTIYVARPSVSFGDKLV